MLMLADLQPPRLLRLRSGPPQAYALHDLGEVTPKSAPSPVKLQRALTDPCAYSFEQISAPLSSAPGEVEEEAKRIAEDGKSYAKAEFQEYYRDAWQIKWDAAGMAKAPCVECAICMDEMCDLMELECGHKFCNDCLEQQLAARWPGPRIVFAYLQCALCRAPLAHPELESSLEEHVDLKQRVLDIAVDRFRRDGLLHDLAQKLDRGGLWDLSQEEIRMHAEVEMAMFMCGDCNDPYCGGRADCAALMQEQAAEQPRRCNECDWNAQAQANDRRCMAHGHRFAIYKCDSCCDVSVWCCDGHHYCDRCHADPCTDKHYPCPGPAQCPLGIAHPPNTTGNIYDDMKHPSFVIGCSACLGFEDEKQEDLGGPAGYNFGYPHRDWADFDDGGDLLKKVGEEEVRARLRVVRPPLPADGHAAECAERLLLHEQGVRTPEALLAASSAAVLRHRLLEAGLSSDGQPLECAQRLLFLLVNKPLESLKLWDAREALRPPQGARRRRRRNNHKGNKIQEEEKMIQEEEKAPMQQPQMYKEETEAEKMSLPLVIVPAAVAVGAGMLALAYFFCNEAVM
mmetsp:Transcript_12123/g.22232  ORF Transcript_12123/g.22232 Transcript_12123/m.22232 type:complete len:568 (-) Transcript_12123:107-1810(-)